MDYVAGFLFNSNKTEVVLVLKNRPVFQQGKFNGVGGKIEPGETPHAAMIREFKEETGVAVYSWRQFCTLEGFWGKVNYFVATGDLYDVRTMTDEHIGVYKVGSLNTLPIMPQLQWLIPMALYKDNYTATVTEFGFGSNN